MLDIRQTPAPTVCAAGTGWPMNPDDCLVYFECCELSDLPADLSGREVARFLIGRSLPVVREHVHVGIPCPHGADQLGHRPASEASDEVRRSDRSCREDASLLAAARRNRSVESRYDRPVLPRAAEVDVSRDHVFNVRYVYAELHL